MGIQRNYIKLIIIIFFVFFLFSFISKQTFSYDLTYYQNLAIKQNYWQLEDEYKARVPQDTGRKMFRVRNTNGTTSSVVGDASEFVHFFSSFDSQKDYVWNRRDNLQLITVGDVNRKNKTLYYDKDWSCIQKNEDGTTTQLNGKFTLEDTYKCEVHGTTGRERFSGDFSPLWNKRELIDGCGNSRGFHPSGPYYCHSQSVDGKGGDDVWETVSNGGNLPKIKAGSGNDWYFGDFSYGDFSYSDVSDSGGDWDTYSGCNTDPNKPMPDWIEIIICPGGGNGGEQSEYFISGGGTINGGGGDDVFLTTDHDTFNLIGGYGTETVVFGYNSNWYKIKGTNDKLLNSINDVKITRGGNQNISLGNHSVDQIQFYSDSVDPHSFIGYGAGPNNLIVPSYTFKNLADALHVAGHGDTIKLSIDYGGAKDENGVKIDDIYPFDKDVTIECHDPGPSDRCTYGLEGRTTKLNFNDNNFVDDFYGNSENANFAVDDANVLFKRIELSGPGSASKSSRIKVRGGIINFEKSKVNNNYIGVNGNGIVRVDGKSEFYKNGAYYISLDDNSLRNLGGAGIKSGGLQSIIRGRSKFYNNEVGVYGTGGSVIVKNSIFYNHSFPWVPEKQIGIDFNTYNRLKGHGIYFDVSNYGSITTKSNCYGSYCYNNSTFHNNDIAIESTGPVNINTSDTIFRDNKLQEEKRIRTSTTGYGILINNAREVFIGKNTIFEDNIIAVLVKPYIVRNLLGEIIFKRGEVKINGASFKSNGLKEEKIGYYEDYIINTNRGEIPEKDSDYGKLIFKKNNRGINEMQTMITPAVSIGRVNKFIVKDTLFNNTQDEFNIITGSDEFKLSNSDIYDGTSTENYSINIYTGAKVDISNNRFIQSEFTDSYYNINLPSGIKATYEGNRFINNSYIHNYIFSNSYNEYIKKSGSISYVNSNENQYDINDWEKIKKLKDRIGPNVLDKLISKYDSTFNDRFNEPIYKNSFIQLMESKKKLSGLVKRNFNSEQSSKYKELLNYVNYNLYTLIKNSDKIKVFELVGEKYLVTSGLVDREKSWREAIKHCNDLEYIGYDDWFLPNKEELMALYDNKTNILGFEDGTTGWYWSSESIIKNNLSYSKKLSYSENIPYYTQYATAINFNNGSFGEGDKEGHINYVRCIRKEGGLGKKKNKRYINPISINSVNNVVPDVNQSAEVTHSVTFVNGTNSSSRNIVDGKTVGGLPDLTGTKTGYTFNGWFRLPNGGGGRITFEEPITKDISFYSHFIVD